MTTVNLGTVVSGTVEDTDCGDAFSTTCTESGFGGMPIVVVGRGTDGTAVDESTTTDTDGTWSLNVPTGTYAVAPSADGQTVAPGGFDPEQYPETVGATAIPDLNFVTCTDAGDGVSAAADTMSAAGSPFAALRNRAADGGRGPMAHAASASFNPSDCKSYYTFGISANIPEAHIVDPSTDARYQTSSFGGYNRKRNTLGLLSGSSALHTVDEFPACLSDAEVIKDTAAGDRALWYTYISGGSLGHVTATLQWDRKAQQVHFVDPPDEADGGLTRWFVYRIRHRDGTYTKGRCFQREPVDILTASLGGADDPALGLPTNEFVILTTWEFPFDAPGVKIDVNGSIVQSVISAASGAAERLISWYNTLPKGARLTLNFLISYAIGTGKVTAIAKAPALIKYALSGTKFALTATQIEKLELAGEIGHILAHGKHNVDTASELLESIAGYLGEEETGEPEYPVMAALIRGRFQTEYLQRGGKNFVGSDGNFVPVGSVLALRAVTTKFPTISLTMTRSALAAIPTAVDSRPVYNGPLPWASGLGSPAVYNPFSNHFGSTGVLADATKTGHSYTIGLTDVKNVIADTSQLPRVSEGLRDDVELLTGLTHDEQGDRTRSAAPITQPRAHRAASPTRSAGSSRTIARRSNPSPRTAGRHEPLSRRRHGARGRNARTLPRRTSVLGTPFLCPFGKDRRGAASGPQPPQRRGRARLVA